MPLLEENDSSLTREDAINQVIVSIAQEELGLSCLINAEGEKLQYILGTLSGTTGPSATIEEVLEANRSISEVLKGVVEDQTLLGNKLKTVLSSAVLTGPTGPTGPTGSTELLGIQYSLVGGGDREIAVNHPVIFDTNIVVDPTISYDDINGKFTVTRNGYYMIDWWVSVDGSVATDGVSFAINVGGVRHSRGSSKIVTGQVSGSSLVVITNAPVEIDLTNVSEDPLTFEATDVQANIVIAAIPVQN